MAAYTSTQTGLWNDSATWGGGGYPSAAGDTATIAHEVVYNLTDSSSEFYGDVTINTNGHFRHLTGTHLNMNGTIYVNGGTYELVDDVTVAFTGNNSHDHGIYINTHNYTTFLANGTTPVAETRMSTSGDAGDYYIPVDDASDFQTGDWISVFFRYSDLKSREDFLNETSYPKGAMQGEGVTNTGQYGNTIYSSNIDRFHNKASHSVTEGFIIHDIDNNNIYPRDLVGPDSSIESATTNKITVTQSKVFREKQRIIFGHGSKRTASRISSINYRTHEITLEDNLSSTDVVGESVYLGALKIHKYKRTVVRTVGNQVTAEAAANATTITLNNVGDYSVGDKFYVEHNVKEDADWDTVMPNNHDSWYQSIQIRHEITGISGNTLTFSPALPYKVYSGAFAYKANRPITIKGASDDPSDGTCKPYIYAAENGTGRTIDQMTRYRRKLIIKDVEFLGIGNSSSNYQYHLRGGFNDGYWRYSCMHEGIVIDGMGNTHANYLCRVDGGYYHNYENIIVANGYRGLYSGREGIEVCNSVVINCRRGADSFGIQNVSGKSAYLRFTRNYEYLRVYHRSMGMNIAAYQIYGENEHSNYCFNSRNFIYQCHFVGRYYLVRDGWQHCEAAYIKFDQYSSEDYKKRYFYYAGNDRLSYYTEFGGMTIYEQDYLIDNDVTYDGGILSYDQTEGAYLLTNGVASGNPHPTGYFERIMLKPNETITVRAAVKIHPDNPNSNWSYRPHLTYAIVGNQSLHRYPSRGTPYLNVTGGEHLDYDFDFVGDTSKLSQNLLFPSVNFGQYGAENYDSSSFADAWSNRTQFDSKTEYIEQTITITNDAPFTRTCYYGLGKISDNSAHGFYFKPLVVARNQSQTTIGKLMDSLKRIVPTYITKGTVAKRQKKRIGGARL